MLYALASAEGGQFGNVLCIAEYDLSGAVDGAGGTTDT
jgi:hypothetical protein